VNTRIACAKCGKYACHGQPEESPRGCPARTEAQTIEHAVEAYSVPETKEFARQASIQEFECYMNLPEGRTPRNPRVEEIVQFAKKMKYRKLGVAFCYGLRAEARILNEILENRGFEVASVCCKVGSVPKEELGLTVEQKIAGPDAREAMCNPIAQAELLNAKQTEFNIVVGLCVGHDSLFFKHSTAPVTVLVAKDRVFGHNPVAGLYTAKSYYKKLMRKE